MKKVQEKFEIKLLLTCGTERAKIIIIVGAMFIGVVYSESRENIQICKHNNKNKNFFLVT